MVQIIGLTESEFQDRLNIAVRKAMGDQSQQPDTQPKEFIKGIWNLAKFLNCSAPKAQALKNNKVISCFQDGRLILFDPDTVRAEMAAYNQSKKRR
jgi:hypothetical protein